MRAQSVNKTQQLKYILECRSSGLTDYQWCKEHNIHPGTFYNWVSKLKKEGCQDIPDPVSRLGHAPAKQEIVKLNVMPDESQIAGIPEEIEQNACFSEIPSKDSVIEIVFPTATIRFVNGANPMLFAQALKLIGGGPC